MDVANRLVISAEMAGQLTSYNWGSFPAGREKCSAGACPQLGVGCVAQTTPDPSINQCTSIVIPWCAGASRHERLVRQ